MGTFKPDISDVSMNEISQILREVTDSKHRNLNCNTCDKAFMSETEFKCHTETHHPQVHICTECNIELKTELDLQTHLQSIHEKEKSLEWNCNDCPMQYNTASELRNHLKITSHQPSKTVVDRKSIFLDYMKCYTCQLEFEGYKNLMEHRKNSHPSKKI